VQVPEGVVEGTGRITFSFPAWPQGRLAPRTVEFEVKPARPAVAFVADDQTPVTSGDAVPGGWLLYGGVGAACVSLVLLLFLRIQRATTLAQRGGS
jgi:hypothetical protein